MAAVRFQEDAEVTANLHYRGAYYKITFQAPTIVPHVQAGQFVHLMVPGAPHLTLRRPFSIFDVDCESGALSLIFKNIGAGTSVMSTLQPGTIVNLIGPLGNGFPPPAKDSRILIVAGGYGCAATYLIAKRTSLEGVTMLGGRNEIDILVQEEFAATGFDVRISTNDGSLGHPGLVTVLLEEELDKLDGAPASIYACGPNAMLQAVSDLALPRGYDAALSLDMNMGCGVGACFTCVVKLKADNEDGWEYIRTCKDGPVFMASQVHWGVQEALPPVP